MPVCGPLRTRKNCRETPSLAWAFSLCLFLPGTVHASEALRTSAGYSVQNQADGVLAILGLSVIPNETASTLYVSTSNGDGYDFRATQFGGAFTVSDNFPLYLEGFLGLARYSPTFVLAGGSEEFGIDAKWTSIAGTVGIGWDIPLTDEVALRPIANGSLGHIESDASLFGRYLGNQLNREIHFLEDGRLNAAGYGASLMLDWERYRPDYEIDVELRYSHIHLESISGSSDAVRGSADAITMGLWSRLRVPTGYRIFDAPFRAVGELSASNYMGDQRKVIDSYYLLQLGTGVEVDYAEVSWLPISRTRLMARYLIGEDVHGLSFGLGISF